MKAYCWRSGQIGFGRHCPRGARLIADVRGRSLRTIVSVVARHSYDGSTLLVPGVPEAASDLDALVAVEVFRSQVVRRLKPAQRSGSLLP